jgi:ABC-type glutathione transport system ATPase component
VSVTVVERPLLEVRDVDKTYRAGGVERHALRGVSFELQAGRTLAVVGESGAGKSTLTRLIAGLERPSAGQVLVGGEPPAPRRGRPSPVQMVFQHPGEALSPYHSIGWSIAEGMHEVPRRERTKRIRELLAAVNLGELDLRRRPQSFSGGQLQRIVIARALAASPQVLLCDEPTSALDVSVQAQIVNLLLRLRAELGFACVLVTHDLAVARVLADEVLVLKDGAAVERGAANAFFAGPSDPYAISLLATALGETLHRGQGVTR